MRKDRQIRKKLKKIEDDMTLARFDVLVYEIKNKNDLEKTKKIESLNNKINNIWKEVSVLIKELEQIEKSK